MEDDDGPRFELREGVPHRGCVSPTLYPVFTIDCPPPVSECIQYADDLTQIIISPFKWPRFTAAAAEIQNLNRDERRWKIKKRKQTKVENFSIGRRKVTEVRIR